MGEKREYREQSRSVMGPPASGLVSLGPPLALHQAIPCACVLQNAETLTNPVIGCKNLIGIQMIAKSRLMTWIRTLGTS